VEQPQHAVLTHADLLSTCHDIVKIVTILLVYPARPTYLGGSRSMQSLLMPTCYAHVL
jgi:hypothetical protein